MFASWKYRPNALSIVACASGVELPHRLPHRRGVAELPRAAGARAHALLGSEELLALLLDEHPPEQRAEQAHVPPQRPVRLLLPARISHAPIIAGAHSWRAVETMLPCPTVPRTGGT